MHCLPQRTNALEDLRKDKKAEQNSYNSASFPFDQPPPWCLNTQLKKYLIWLSLHISGGTEIVFTGPYDLTKLYGHCWIPVEKNPGIPAAPHDSAGHRAKIFQTASDKASRWKWVHARHSVLLWLSSQLKGYVHMYKYSSTPIKLSFFTGWAKNSQTFPSWSRLWTF